MISSCNKGMTNSLPAISSIGILNYDPSELCCEIPENYRERRSYLIIVKATKGAVDVLPQLLSFGRGIDILLRSHLLKPRRFNIPSAYPLLKVLHPSIVRFVVFSFRNLSTFLRRSKHSSPGIPNP